jgi:hypothetical protein
MGIVLLELDLMLCDWVALRVKNEESGTGGTIVNGTDKGLVRLVRL